QASRPTRDLLRLLKTHNSQKNPARGQAPPLPLDVLPHPADSSVNSVRGRGVAARAAESTMPGVLTFDVAIEMRKRKYRFDDKRAGFVVQPVSSFTDPSSLPAASKVKSEDTGRVANPVTSARVCSRSKIVVVTDSTALENSTAPGM